MALSSIQEIIDQMEDPNKLYSLISGQITREVNSLELSDLLPNGPGQPPLIYQYLRLFQVNEAQHRRLMMAVSSATRDSGVKPTLSDTLTGFIQTSFDLHMNLRSRHLDILETIGDCHSPVLQAYMDMDSGKIDFYEFQSIAKREAVKAFAVKFQKDRFPNGISKENCQSPEIMTHIKELATIIVLMDDKRKDTTQEELDKLILDCQRAIPAIYNGSRVDRVVASMEDLLRREWGQDTKRKNQDVQD